MTDLEGSQGRSAPPALVRVAFTGRLMSMTRPRAAEVVRALGGTVTTTVSRRTSTLVVGMGGWPLLSDGSVSGKVTRAEALNRRGARIRIVSEAVFLELAGLEERSPHLRKTYSHDQVRDLLGLDEQTLRRWEVMGLIEAVDGRYDFQDIVSLRTIAELTSRGVRPAVIARSVRGLASVLPGTERPLAQLKLVEASGELLAELGDAFMAPDGQLVINFSPVPDDPGERLRLAAADDRDTAWTAGEWFEHGGRCEEEDLFDEAIDAYRRALALRAHFPEAHFNLGNTLRAAGRLEAAQEQFLMAVTQDATLAAAWFNLADVQEELGDLDGAITSLVAALRADHDYADAHYNLAICYEHAGDQDRSRRHWSAYLRLDPDSPWADAARTALAAAGRGAGRP